MVELVYKFDEKSYHKCLKRLKYEPKISFGSQTYIHIYMDTNTDHFTPLALRVWGNNCKLFLFLLKSAKF